MARYLQSQRSIPQDTIVFKNIHLYKDQTLGIGSYGKVCKAKCDDLICAAKVMHETLFDPATSQLVQGLKREHRLPIKRFERECEFLSTLKHPNIIQYLMVYIDPDTGLPALLMELMDDNLTHFLESSPQPVPYHIQINLCHDITLALSFLHSNSIIHRDLSGNNVLLISHVRAKVTDFGMARLGDYSPQISQLTYTMCPGTDAYMPPEAVKEEPDYSEKIDCFSFGVIVLQILTREFPKPGNRRKEVEISHPGLPSGMVEVRVSEIERRQKHIGKINPNHPLLPIALDCLKDKDTERPVAQQLCEKVASLKQNPKYEESMGQIFQEKTAPDPQIRETATDKGSKKELESLRQRHVAEVEGLERVIHLQTTQLEDREQSIQQKDLVIGAAEEEIEQWRQQCQELQFRLAQYQEEISSNQLELQRLDRYIVGKDQTIKERERQLKEQMETSEQVIAQFEERVHELEHQLKSLQDHQNTPQAGVQPLAEAEAGMSQDENNIKLIWREGSKAPYRMSSHYGVAVDGNSVYFKPGGREVYEYRVGKEWYLHIPDCPFSHGPLVVVNKLLTLVGGSQQEVYSNKLFSLTGEGSSTARKRWTEEFPPMPTKRSNTAAICTGTSLIVAGGQGKGAPVMTTVEVMNTWTSQWSTAAHLPEPMWAASTAMCGDRIYILGGWDKNSSVFVCSLSALLHSCKSKTSTLTKRRFKSQHSTKDDGAVWKRLANVPVTWFACVSFNSQLLVIGGLNSDNQPITNVHVYNPSNNTWEVVSHTLTARRQCFAAVLPDNQLMVMGGITESGDSTDTVEIAISQ